MIVFDRQQLIRQRARAIPRFHDYDFLFQTAAGQIIDRLTDIKRDFHNVLIIGARGGEYILQRLNTLDSIKGTTRVVELDTEILPAPHGELYDLVLSVLELHTINDLPGILAQIQLQMKPDGVFCAAMLGGETLHELRASLQSAELALRCGVSPRIYPFADKQQMGALLQRAKFALPVVDSEFVRVEYRDLTRLLHDLRGMGEGNAIVARDKTIPPRTLFTLAEQFYRKEFSSLEGHLTATFEIIHLIGWAPAASQPRALKPGSATIRLADALQTHEVKTGEKTTP